MRFGCGAGARLCAGVARGWLLLDSCGRGQRRCPRSASQQIQPGQTSKAEILDWFGAPEAYTDPSGLRRVLDDGVVLPEDVLALPYADVLVFETTRGRVQGSPPDPVQLVRRPRGRTIGSWCSSTTRTASCTTAIGGAAMSWSRRLACRLAAGPGVRLHDRPLVRGLAAAAPTRGRCSWWARPPKAEVLTRLRPSGPHPAPEAAATSSSTTTTSATARSSRSRSPCSRGSRSSTWEKMQDKSDRLMVFFDPAGVVSAFGYRQGRDELEPL